MQSCKYSIRSSNPSYHFQTHSSKQKLLKDVFAIQKLCFAIHSFHSNYSVSAFKFALILAGAFSTSRTRFILSRNVKFLLISHLTILIHQTRFRKPHEHFTTGLARLLYTWITRAINIMLKFFCGFLRLSNFITKQIAFPNKSRHQTNNKHSCFWINIFLLFF